MASTVVKNAIKTIREKCVGPFLRELKEEGFTLTKIHNIGARLVGIDQFGYKYYEKLEDTQFGRHRWVEYADKGRYNASQVPPFSGATRMAWLAPFHNRMSF